MTCAWPANRLLATALALGAMAAFGGCAHSTAARQPAPPPATACPVRLELVPGERATLPGGAALHYVALVSDSRCPPGAQCIHAGEAVLGFELLTASGARSFELKTAAPHDAAFVDGRRIRLLDVVRGTPARAGVAIDGPN